MGLDGCTRAPLAPSHADDRARGPDLLRKERFGALYYTRRTSVFEALPPGLARLLIDAANESALLAYARAPERYGLSEVELCEQVALWRRQGVLDDDYRCRARILDEERDPGALTGPLVTHLSLTRACNLRCEHCYVDVMAKPAPDELTTGEILSLFAELDRIGSPVVVMAGGEPMVRRDLFEILDGVARHHIDAWLCTNATLVREDNAERLAASALRGFSVSLDGPDAETHERLRGAGRFEHALRGIRLLVEADARDVQIRVTVTPHNAGRLLDFAPLATELGAHKVVFKPFRQSGHAGGQDQLHIDRKSYLDALVRARDAWPKDACPADFGDGLPSRPPSWTGIIPPFGCVGGTVSASVTWNGRVVACGSVLEEGDWTLRERSFREAWLRAPTLAAWRRLESDGSCTSCGNFSRCGGGCRARALGKGRPMSAPDPWSYCSEHAHDDERAVRSRPLPVLP